MNLVRRIPQNYEECFLEMARDRTFQNVASKMLTGHYAYDDTHFCVDQGTEACAENMESVLRGACNLNFITMW